jgi:hypothetical protein
MLTRQWLVGELRGEDAGSPAWAQLAATTAPFTGWRVEGETDVGPLTPADPIEDLVESEPFTPDLSLRVELGQLFDKLLADVGAARPVVAAIRYAYQLPPPARPEDPPPAPLLTLSLAQRPNLNSRKLAPSLVTAFGKGGVVLSRKATIKMHKANVWWTITDPAYDRRYTLRWKKPAKRVAVLLDVPAELDVDREAQRLYALCAGRAILT